MRRGRGKWGLRCEIQSTVQSYWGWLLSGGGGGKGVMACFEMPPLGTVCEWEGV
jgi:hypothetical protein